MKRLIVTSPDAAMQKLGTVDPPFRLAKGEMLDRAALQAFARRCGYLDDERADEPGDIAVQGRVIDIYPADARAPVRLDLDEDGRICDLQIFDVASQRTEAPLDQLALVPASEVALPDDVPRSTGIEHRLSAYQPDLRSLFELLSGAALAQDAGALAACRRFASRTVDAFETRRAFTGSDEGVLQQPDRLYLTSEMQDDALAGRPTLDVSLKAITPMRSFAVEFDAMRAFVAFVASALKNGQRVVVAGFENERAPLVRALKRGKIEMRPAKDWPEALQADVGTVATPPTCSARARRRRTRSSLCWRRKPRRSRATSSCTRITASPSSPDSKASR